MLEDMDLFKANSALAFFRVHSFFASVVAAFPLGGVVLLPPTTSHKSLLTKSTTSHKSLLTKYDSMHDFHNR
ncbi:hypothetical protein F2Q69_00005425 [Brassica cretica]|uniref:Uncharacterized protein n=1 Tax=Brassica cretica TaxID=69181 RepID=A0A8S9NV59_BRACR|nr:hypothetical protein F2Q69_00005425 [Brassica cretica]